MRFDTSLLAALLLVLQGASVAVATPAAPARAGVSMFPRATGAQYQPRHGSPPVPRRSMAQVMADRASLLQQRAADDTDAQRVCRNTTSNTGACAAISSSLSTKYTTFQHSVSLSSAASSDQVHSSRLCQCYNYRLGQDGGQGQGQGSSEACTRGATISKDHCVCSTNQAPTIQSGGICTTSSAGGNKPNCSVGANISSDNCVCRTSVSPTLSRSGICTTSSGASDTPTCTSRQLVANPAGTTTCSCPLASTVTSNRCAPRPTPTCSVGERPTQDQCTCLTGVASTELVSGRCTTSSQGGNSSPPATPTCTLGQRPGANGQPCNCQTGVAPTALSAGVCTTTSANNGGTPTPTCPQGAHTATPDPIGNGQHGTITCTCGPQSSDIPGLLIGFGLPAAGCQPTVSPTPTCSLGQPTAAPCNCASPSTASNGICTTSSGNGNPSPPACANGQATSANGNSCSCGPPNSVASGTCTSTSGGGTTPPACTNGQATAGPNGSSCVCNQPSSVAGGTCTNGGGGLTQCSQGQFTGGFLGQGPCSCGPPGASTDAGPLGGGCQPVSSGSQSSSSPITTPPSSTTSSTPTSTSTATTTSPPVTTTSSTPPPETTTTTSTSTSSAANNLTSIPFQLPSSSSSTDLFNPSLFNTSSPAALPTVAVTGINMTSSTSSDTNPYAAATQAVTQAPPADDTLPLPGQISPLTPQEQPINTTSISLRFIDGPFSYNNVANLVNNTAGLLFANMPTIVSAALGTDIDQVKTYQLVPFRQSNDTDATFHHAQTVWQGFIPTELTGPLQTAVNTANSSLYTGQNTANRAWIASNLDMNQNIFSGAGNVKSQQANANQGGNGTNPVVRDALIGVFVGLAGVLLLLLAFILFRRRQKQKERAAIRRPASIRSNRSALRETWHPNSDERDRVMAGELAETWSHHDGARAAASVAPSRDPFGDDQNAVGAGAAAAGTGAVAASAAGVSAVNHRTSHQTERSHQTHNTGHSDQSLTPSQRIRLEYEQSNPSGQAITTDSAQVAPEMRENRGGFI